MNNLDEDFKSAINLTKEYTKKLESLIDKFDSLVRTKTDLQNKEEEEEGRLGTLVGQDYAFLKAFVGVVDQIIRHSSQLLDHNQTPKGEINPSLFFELKLRTMELECLRVKAKHRPT